MPLSRLFCDHISYVDIINWDCIKVLVENTSADGTPAKADPIVVLW